MAQNRVFTVIAFVIYDKNWSCDSLNDRPGKALYVYPSYGQSNFLQGLYRGQFPYGHLWL